MILGALGVLSLGAGVLAVFVSDNGTGSGVLVAFGGAVLVLALLGNHLESFEFGGAKLRLRAAAAERFARAEASDERGDTAEATRLRTEAQALMSAADPIAAEYRTVRSSMRAGPDRSRAMERVVAQAGRLAKTGSFEREGVARWLREGGDEERITALGMMQAVPDLRDFSATVAAIEDSRSAFEQYHAMLLALKMADGLDATERRRLAEAVRSVRGLRFRHDSDRWQVSEEILRRTE